MLESRFDFMTAPKQQLEPFPVKFPPLDGRSAVPVWTGRGFQIGQQQTAVLSYGVGLSGWTDELTCLQEDTSGEDHYIERASRKHTIRQLRRWLSSERPVIVDIGCSNGLILRLLRREFPNAAIIGADYVGGSLEQLARLLDGIPILRFDLTDCPLPDESVDAVVLLNVLEHIEHDRTALAHVARILKPNGIAIIEVPAAPQLFDIYDKVWLHRRRYSMQELLEKLAASGLRPLEKSHLGFFLYPAFWAVKKRNQRYLSQNIEIQRKIVSRAIKTARSHTLLHAVMEMEARLRSKFYYPFGIRSLVTCRRA